MKDYNLHKYDDALVDDLNKVDFLQDFDRVDIQDICDLLSEPFKNVNQCISKGQLKNLCKQLLIENVALRKMVNKGMLK